MAFWAALPGIIGGLGSLAGGIASLTGAGQQRTDNRASIMNAEQDRAFQMAAMQHGIRWKVADAQAAGIHPLFAMGAPPFNPSSTSVGDVHTGGSNIGGALQQMGQGVERALHATSTKPERDQLIKGQAIEALALERAQLQNELLRAQINSTNARLGPSQVGPAFPNGADNRLISGQGNSPVVNGPMGPFEPKPTEVTTTNPAAPVQAAGPASPVIRWGRTAEGYQAFPVGNLGMEDEFGAPMSTDFLIRNRLLPNVSRLSERPPLELVRRDFPGATGVTWSHRNQAWVPVYPQGRDYVHRAPRPPEYNSYNWAAW